MTANKKPPKVVREPVQVYLARPDRDLLNRAAKKAGVSKAEILRLGLRRIGGEVMNNESPMLKLLDENVAQGPVAGVPADLAIRHDDYLAESSLDRHSAKTR